MVKKKKILSIYDQYTICEYQKRTKVTVNNRNRKTKTTNFPCPHKLLNQKEKTIENCFWLFTVERENFAA